MAVGPGTDEYHVYRGANYAIIREHAGMYFEVMPPQKIWGGCLLYTSDAADE